MVVLGPGLLHATLILVCVENTRENLKSGSANIPHSIPHKNARRGGTPPSSAGIQSF